MNLNRRRNIFNVADSNLHQTPQQHHIKEQIIRRKNTDPFERDPFKIQSYNFRYADRPTYPLQHLVNRVSPQKQQQQEAQSSSAYSKPFETYYVNHGFATSRTDKENPSTNRFHEHRRRKFLHEQQHHQQPARPAAALGQTTIGAAGAGGVGVGRSGSSSGIGRQPNPLRQQTPRQYSTGADICNRACRSFSRDATNVQPHATHSSANGINASGHLLGRAGISSYAPNTAPPLPLLRTGCNQEFLQGLCSSPAVSSQQRSGMGTTHNSNGGLGGGNRRNSSRSSLYDCEAAGGGSALGIHTEKRHYTNVVGGCRGGSISTTAVAGSRGGGKRVPSPSQLHRNAVPTVHVVSQNLGAAVLEHKDCTSGCQININIRGLDNPQLGDNLTISIDTADGSAEASSGKRANLAAVYSADDGKKVGHELHGPIASETRTNNLSDRITSPNGIDSFNIKLPTASEAYNLDKSTASSKYGLDGRPTAGVRCENKENKRTEKEPPWNTEAGARSKRRSSGERVASLLPWKLDDKLRKCFTNDALIDPDSGQFRPTNQMRRIRQAYDSTKNDVRNMQSYRQRFNTTAPKVPERKLLNTTNKTRRLESHTPPPVPKPTAMTAPLHRLASHNSLRAAYEVTKCYYPETLNRSARPQLHRTRSSQSPVNVNINVYTDQMKLLRV